VCGIFLAPRTPGNFKEKVELKKRTAKPRHADRATQWNWQVAVSRASYTSLLCLEKMGHAVCNFVKLTVAGLLADGAGARVDSRSGFSFLLLVRRALDSIATETYAVSGYGAKSEPS
jgi:hypothetical protein